MCCKTCQGHWPGRGRARRSDREKKDGGRLTRHWKGREEEKQGGLTNKPPDRRWWGEDFPPVDPPTLHRGGTQTTAQPVTLTQTLLFFFIFHFCEVELGRLFVGDVIFIIIIIINIIVSLPSLFVVVWIQSAGHTSLAEDGPRRRTDGRTDGGEDSSLGDGVGTPPVVGTTVMVLLAGRLFFGFGALFRVNTFAKLPLKYDRETRSVYCIFIVRFQTELRFCPLITFVSDSSLLSWKGM